MSTGTEQWDSHTLGRVKNYLGNNLATYTKTEDISFASSTSPLTSYLVAMPKEMCQGCKPQLFWFKWKAKTDKEKVKHKNLLTATGRPSSIIHMKLKNHPNGKFFKNHGVCNSPVIGREHYPAYLRDWVLKKSSLRESGRFCSTSYNSLKKHGASLPPHCCLSVQSKCPCSFKNNRLRILMRACKILESDLGTEILLWTLVKCSLPQIVS